jgi:hypothetical protein
MISCLRAVSRLPVGSSASSSDGPVTTRARDGDALLLAARELVREGGRLGGEPHLREHARDLGADVLLRRADHLEGERHVLLRRAVLEEPEVLEDDAEPAAERGDLPGGQRRRTLAGDLHLAVRGAFLDVDELEHRALARARGTGEEDELPAIDVEGDVVDRGAALRVLLRDVGEADHRVT